MGNSSGLPSMRDSLDQEPEPIVLFINLEPEEEETTEEMAPILKVGFKERHRKHLNKALPAAPPPTKKSCLEAPHEEPV